MCGGATLEVWWFWGWRLWGGGWQCTCLNLWIRNAIPEKGDSALALILRAAMHFRVRHAVCLLDFWVLYCPFGFCRQCTCLISDFCTVFSSSCGSAFSPSLASVLHFRLPSTVRLPFLWPLHCTSGFRRQYTCPFSGFCTALPASVDSALALSLTSVLSFRLLPTVHLP